jgi:hypothetical protein
MSIKPAISELESSNNILFKQFTYDTVQKTNVFSTNNGSQHINENLASNEITNNTITPPRSISPYAYHPTLINNCTLVNTYINNGLYVPYVSERSQFKPLSIEEIYYKT